MFDELIAVSRSASRSIFQTILARLRSTEVLLREKEKLAQLGTLSAGLAHELNNPSAAIARGVNVLREEANVQFRSSRVTSRADS